jgi:hypothetical protein
MCVDGQLTWQARFTKESGVIGMLTQEGWTSARKSDMYSIMLDSGWHNLDANTEDFFLIYLYMQFSCFEQLKCTKEHAKIKNDEPLLQLWWKNYVNLKILADWTKNARQKKNFAWEGTYTGDSVVVDDCGLEV